MLLLYERLRSRERPFRRGGGVGERGKEREREREGTGERRREGIGERRRGGGL